MRRELRSPRIADLLGREVVRGENPCPDRIVDVVVQIGHSIDDADDLSLERRRLARPGVVEDPVARLPGEVQTTTVPLEHLDDPQRVLVVAEPAAEARLEHRVEGVLARVAERRVPEIMAKSDRLGQVLVQTERAGDDTSDPGRFERVRQPGAEMVVAERREDLRLVLEAAEGLRMDDPVAVALEGRSKTAGLLVVAAAACLVRAHGVRRKPLLLMQADTLFERIGHVPASSGISS